MPTLSADNNNENEGAKNRKDKNNIVDGKNSHSSKSKNKPKIYSSSDEVVEEVIESKTTPAPKKAESSDDYYDGWTKEDVAQLISRIGSALPKNDTLKYVSRVEKLNWEQVAFGQYSSSECKEKWKIIEKKIRGYRILQEVLADAKVWLEHPWMDFYRGGKNKNRHPDMPKKPLTSYMIFYMKKKESITKENPGIGLTSLSKIIADKFNKLSPKKKAKYNKLANAMREKYQEDMQKFFQDHPGEGEKIMNAAKYKKAPILGVPGPDKPLPPLKGLTKFGRD
uniref:HMG box domain-containing protein n=1 Tax=Rhodnius prolixus TaxID=13249 RepID=T1I8H6_RHOPR